MTSDDAIRSRDVSHKARGPGLAYRWHCLGCKQLRSILGTKGLGIRKRCSVCVQAKLGGIV